MNEHITKFDASDYIDSPEVAAELLNQAAQESERAFFVALSAVAKAYGMSEVARATGNERSGLYRALSANSANTQFTTVSKVLQAVGLKLEIKPAA